jgi:hypothetical protein
MLATNGIGYSISSGSSHWLAAQPPCITVPKDREVFHNASDQRKRIFYSERQLALAGGPAALYYYSERS